MEKIPESGKDVLALSLIPRPPLRVQALHPALGNGTAGCGQDCVQYDTSECSNQNVVLYQLVLL